MLNEIRLGYNIIGGTDCWIQLEWMGQYCDQMKLKTCCVVEFKFNWIAKRFVVIIKHLLHKRFKTTLTSNYINACVSVYVTVHLTVHVNDFPCDWLSMWLSVFMNMYMFRWVSVCVDFRMTKKRKPTVTFIK